MASCCLMGPQCYALSSPSEKWAGALDTGEEIRDVSIGLVTSGLLASPDCWLDSLQTLNVDVTTTSGACSSMTTTYQKIMALELARCHVHDLGRTLFDESNELYNSAKCSNVQYREHLGECMVHLTPSAETAYTHFLTYVNQLCTRLSREVVMDHFYDISVNLAKAASEAKNQLQETLKQQENVWMTWKQREDLIMEFHKGLQEQLYQEQDRWTSESLLVLSRWQQDQEEWLRRQQDSQQGHLDVMVEQQEELKRQREELTRLSDALDHTHQSIQPWSLSLKDLYQYARMAGCVLRISLHLGGSLVTCWFLTYPRCLCWLRRLLLPLIVACAIVEALFFLNIQSKSNLIHFGDTWEELSTTIRIVFGFCEIVLYVLGCLISPCSRGGHRSSRGVQDDINPRHASPRNNEPKGYHHFHVKQERCRDESVFPYPRNKVSRHLVSVDCEPHRASVVSARPTVPMTVVFPTFPHQDVEASLDRGIDSQKKIASSHENHRSNKGGNGFCNGIALDQAGSQHPPARKESPYIVCDRHKSSSSDDSSTSDSRNSSSSSTSSSSSSSATAREYCRRLAGKKTSGSKRTLDSRMTSDTDSELEVKSQKRPKFFEETIASGAMEVPVEAKDPEAAE